jgi:hypothetical protein
VTLLRRIIREPLFHFLLIGAFLFLWDAAVSPLSEEVRADDKRVVVTPETVRAIADRFQSTWRRAPTTEEITALVDGWVENEIMAREALALSLDVNDQVIRQRLVQKMTFLIDSAAVAAPPETQDLQAFLAARRSDYVVPGRVSFEQVYAGGSREEAEAILDALVQGTSPGSVGRPSLLPSGLRNEFGTAVDATFGTGFYKGLQTVELGVWAGPVESGYGYHLVRVSELQPETLPELDAVRARVEEDWRAQRRAEQAERVLAELRKAYTIEKPDMAQVEGLLQ